MMKNLIVKMMLKKVFALFSQSKLIWLALLMFGTTAHAGVTVRYQHTDSLGSVIMETNASGQMIGSRHQYQPFGQGLNGQKTGLGYTGHLEDTDLGLTYMQQRYYDPVIGRFYSNDPVGFTASNPMMFNRYAYANNNPYKYVDPDGRAVVYWGLTGGASAGVSAAASHGRFLEVTSDGIRFGKYTSYEAGASTTPPSGDGGIEIGAMTGLYESAMTGPYILAGAEGAAGLGGTIAGVSTLSDSPDFGVQFTAMLGTPQLGAYQHTGYGEVNKDDVTTLKFSVLGDMLNSAVDSAYEAGRGFSQTMKKVLDN